jgi:hypothetical protein
MTKFVTVDGRCEWVTAQVDATGRDLRENAGVVWAEELSIVTIKEARAIIQRKSK